MEEFTHLHVHTQYSILDGANDIKKLIERAKELGMNALSITDHGNMFGVKVFYNEAIEKGIKPIIGCENYVAKTDRKIKNDKDRGDHLILLAKNLTGYHNLVKINSLAWLEGFYYNPRIDRELLEKYHEGLICSTACLGGVIPEIIRKSGKEKAKEEILWFKNIFGDDFYLELMRHKTGNPRYDVEVFEEQERINNVLMEISAELGIKCIATNDVHFTNKSDAEAHDRLICINTGKFFDETDRLSYTKQEYLKSPDEMREIFADFPEAISNVKEIIDKVEVYELNRKPLMPDFPIPENFESADEYLHFITYEGAAKRYAEITESIKERIDFELNVIKKMGFSGYFLIIGDVIKSAREMGIAVGPGRGSVAGSVVAYCIGISDVDPIKYNLLFERFLNPERISLPDIDIDFDEDGRDKILQWVVNKYGKNRVAHIVTFGSMAAKLAIRDVGRVHRLSIPEVDYLSKLVPEKAGTSLNQAFKDVKELAEAKNSSNKLIADTLEYAEKLEGSIRQTGIHACGIIIGKEDLINHIPVFKTKESELMITQYEGNIIEQVGMLKMDFLGLKTLSIIKDAVENIRLSKAIELDFSSVPLDDKETYELFSRADTTAIFQFESAGMKKYLRELKPNRFEDLIAMNALYRPGPMEYIPSYILRKSGKEKIYYDHEMMEEVLNETYGITVYQEQVMMLSQIMAGFSRGEADSLRKAIGKKNPALMSEVKKKFMEGCATKEIDEQTVIKIWNDWVKFADYAFNKSHSTCYALIAYQSAYLKAHFQPEFMAAVLSRNFTDIEKITVLMDECKRIGITVLGPDINESYLRFNVNHKGHIRFGLAAVKGLGENTVTQIIEERNQNGVFTDIFDFVERVSTRYINKRSMEALVYAGALDSFGINRFQYFLISGIENSFIEALLKYGGKMQSEKAAPQRSLFSEMPVFVVSKPQIPVGESWSDFEKLNKEKEHIGMYLSAHPLDKYHVEISSFCSKTIEDLKDLTKLIDQRITVSGLITNVKQGTTKNGNPYLTVSIEDYSGSINHSLFGNDYVNFGKFMVKGVALIIRAKVQYRQSYGNTEKQIKEPEIKIENVEMLSELRNKIKNLTLCVPYEEINETFIADLKEKISKYPGNVRLKVKVYDEEEKVQLIMPSAKFKIQVSDSLLDHFSHEQRIYFIMN